MKDGSRLGAVVGGKRLATEEARALWTRFSAHMDANRNDLDGFARSEGFRHAHVVAVGGVATLTLGDVPTEAARAPKDGGPRRPAPSGRARRR